MKILILNKKTGTILNFLIVPVSITLYNKFKLILILKVHRSFAFYIQD